MRRLSRAAALLAAGLLALGDLAAQGTIPVRKDAPPRPTRLRVLAINDVHGALESRPDAQGVRRGGIGPLAAEIARARAECAADCVSILLDGGDEFQGTPASNLAYGRPVVEAFRRLDLSASALGNHEFDWSVDTLRARIREAPYAVLGANVRYADGRPVPWLRPDTIVARGGLRIGVIGLASTETPSLTMATNVRGLRFEPLAPVIDARARALRARGADAVIVAAHSGAFCDRPAPSAPPGTAPTCRGEIVDAARAVTEKIDAIVSGHTHSAVNTVVNGIPIVQARSSGRALGVVDIPLGAGAGPATIEVRDVVDTGAPVPAAVDSVLRRALAAVAPLVERRVAEIGESMMRGGDQFALGNLIADAQRWAGRGDVALMNNGGIRADLLRGPTTYGALFEIHPFANTLARMRVGGRDLRAYLERLVDDGRPRMHVSGIVVTYDLKRPRGSRIVSVATDGGAPLDDARTYDVVLSDFLATGGDGVDLARGAVSVERLDVVDLDALIGYLGTLPSPVRAPAAPRLRAVDAAP